MNFNLPFIPERPEKPRKSGLTMVMDKGLSLREAENFCEVAAEYTDFVKLGFGTGLLTPGLKDKIKIYQQAGIKPYFGGTLFEAFVARNMFDDFIRFISESGVETAEVSDGVLPIEHDKKCGYIETLAKDFLVFSEVGTKLRGKEISNKEWVTWMKSELAAGAWKVIAEARESGNMGIYNDDGSANSQLIMDIRREINNEDILVGSPIKKPTGLVYQTAGFQRQPGKYMFYGSDCFGNIAPRAPGRHVVKFPSLEVTFRTKKIDWAAVSIQWLFYFQLFNTPVCGGTFFQMLNQVVQPFGQVEFFTFHNSLSAPDLHILKHLQQMHECDNF